MIRGSKKAALKLKVQLKKKKKKKKKSIDLAIPSPHSTASVSNFSKQKRVLGEWPRTAFDVCANTNA